MSDIQKNDQSLPTPHAVRPDRRAVVASVAALVTAALAKATEAQSPSPGEIVNGPPSTGGKSLVLESRNSVANTTTISMSAPSDSQQAGEAGPVLRLEAASGGLQVIAPQFANVAGVTTTAAIRVVGLPAIQAIAPQFADSLAATLTATEYRAQPAVLVVGQPTVAAVGPEDRLLQALEPGGPADAASGIATGVMVNADDVGVSFVGIQGYFPNQPALSEALNVTGTAEIDPPAALYGVAAVGAGLRGRALEPGGTGAFLQGPKEGGTAAQLEGDLVVRGGTVKAEGATFSGDVSVNGSLTVEGRPLRPCLPIMGSGTTAARASVIEVSDPGIEATSFVNVVFTAPPRPKGLGISYIQVFKGGFRAGLTDRTNRELGFNWFAWGPC